MEGHTGNFTPFGASTAARVPRHEHVLKTQNVPNNELASNVLAFLTAELSKRTA